MWNRRYSICLGFAAYYNSKYRYDIVHDAWLYYFQKKNVDLFSLKLDNERSYLFTVIKKAFLRWEYHERRKRLVLDEFIEIRSDQKGNRPDKQVEALQLYEIFYSKLVRESTQNEHRHYRTQAGMSLPLQIFQLWANGYDQVAIGERLEVSKQLVGQYVKKIKAVCGEDIRGRRHPRKLQSFSAVSGKIGVQ